MQSSLGTIFIDTSAFKALYDERDEYHTEARKFMDTISAKKVLARGFLTSDYVLDEAITLIRFGHSHSKAVEFIHAIHDSKAVRTIHVEEEDFGETLQLFIRSKDKEWSFTDCTCFTLMKRLGIENAFTFDPHFRQAGYRILP